MKFLAPIPSQFLDETGTPYSSGSVSVYIHGEPRLADIYQNASGNELAPNPFTLDSHGMWMAFVDSGKSYDYLVKDAGGNVVAPYYNVVVPGTEGVSGVSIESPRGTIEVTESVVGGRKEFGIDVNADSFAHSHGSFSHDAVVGASGSFDYDSFTEVGVEGDDIYLSQGRLTLDSGLYHVSVNVLLENSAEDGNSYDVSFEIDGTQFKKSWDNTFGHSETVEVGIDISVDEDGHAVVPSISGLPEGMSCGIPRLDVHRVDGLCVGSSSSTVEHDSTLEGDGSHDNPLSVKDYSSIRSDLAGVIEDLADHETDPGAHQDIRNELSLKEDKSNKVTEWSETLSDDKYPSERLVKESLDNLPPGTAVKGDAETEYRTGNVNLTPANIGAYSKNESDARYKAVQTAVSDPTASGTGLDFIDSVSQNANGEITPHKKTVQDSTTSQKGVVQLNNAIDSTSTTEAATPKAVKDAYDELNSKIVARAVFLSQQEWAAQSLLPGDPAKVYYVEDGTGEDAYTVYVWKASTSEYVEVDESSIDLEGYWHDGPNTTGNGNVVTGISLGNDGVPVVEKNFAAAAETPTFSQASTRGNLLGSGESMATILGKVMKWFDDLRSAAFKTIVTTWSSTTSDDNIPSEKLVKDSLDGKYVKPIGGIPKTDLASGVQTSLGLADSALQPSGNGSNMSVTPDGTSTGTDIGSSTTLMAWAQMFKNLVASLGTAAFKDVPSSGDASSSQVVMGNDSRLSGNVKSALLNGYTVNPSSGRLDLGYRTSASGFESSTCTEAIQAIRVFPGGSMGSLYLSRSQTIGSVAVTNGWWSYIWIPHRTGASSGDNQNYGTLILTPMLSAPYLIIVQCESLSGSNPTYRAMKCDVNSFVYKSSVAGLLKNDGTVDTKTYIPVNLNDIGNAGTTYYKKLAYFSFDHDQTSVNNAGAMFAVQWRSDVARNAGQGILSVSPIENYSDTIKGKVAILNTRDGSNEQPADVKFYVKKLSSDNYELWGYSEGWSDVFARFIGGPIVSVSYPNDRYTTLSGATEIPFGLNADTIDGYHIVVGSSGIRTDTIYIV